MTTIGELILALQNTEDEMITKMKALEEKLEHQAVLARARTNRAYAKRKALKLADPNYVPKKNGRPFRVPQAEEKL